MIMVSAAEAAQEYKATLGELVNNNKTQINLLTILAEDYLEFATSIVQAIEQQVLTAPKDQKLPIIYVMDSIIKNITNSPYKELFSKVIVRIFLHIFLNGDERVRASLYKLRVTWTPLFPPSLLYKLDMKVKEEDSAWPIAAPGSRSNAATRSTVHVNPKFIQQPQSSSGVSKTRSTANGVGSKLPRIEVKKEVVSTEKDQSKDVLGSILSLGDSRPIKDEPDEPTPPPVSSRSPIAGKRKADEPPSDPLTKKRSPHPAQSSKDNAPRGAKREKKGIWTKPPVGNVVSASTVLPGAHAFSVPVLQKAVAAPTPLAPPPAAVSSYTPMPHIYPPAPIASTPVGLPPVSSSYPPMSVVPMSGPPPPFAAAPPSYSMPPPAVGNQYGGLPPAAVHNAPADIAHETVRFEGIPANNRIFVEGKAHEVFYIEDTAVIERNGLPHRIYFSGSPRNVVIDGVAHALPFGESKTVLIDGLPHVLRFGAPSRELFMGTFPFKGQFGGPPIIATIKGIRHEIRLSGPAPEVKIEPDPAYDLSRFMPQVREGKAPEPKKNAESAIELLRRLQQKGFLSQKAAAPVQPSRAEEKPRKMVARENTPPIPSEHTYDSVERRNAPTSSLRDFNMRLLKVRYDAVVDALHQKQHNACPHCGMRMELKGDKYERHLDWHVKKNLQTLERTSASRPWYASGKDWLSTDEEEKQGPSGVKTDSEELSSSTPAVVSHETSCKDCFVCGEKFEEYFDEEDDVWKLKNCVIVGEKTYHSGCAQDASILEPPSVISVKSECIVNELKPVLNTKPFGL